MPKRKEWEKALTSLRVFRKFIVRETKVLDDGSTVEILNAAGITSRECYEMWLQARKGVPAHPEKAFQKSLSSHLNALDGRSPFTPEEEHAILEIVRRKGQWPCFEAYGARCGLMRYRGKGFHEKQREMENYKTTAKSDLSEEEETMSTSDTDNSSSAAALSYTESGVPPVKRQRVSKDDVTINPPPFEDLATEELHPHALSFWRLATLALSRLYDTTADGWETVMSIRRFLSISRGRFGSASLEDAVNVLEEECRKYPEEAVFVLDLVAKKSKDRIMAMNQKMESIIGKVSAKDGGLTRPLFPPSQVWNLLFNQVKAWCSRNKQSEFDFELYNMNSEPVKVRAVIQIRSDKGLVIGRGHVIQDA